MNKPRRAKSRRLPPLPLDASETKCGICLDEVIKRGKIGPCSHLYCFPCLLEWSKVNNTCPQCKLTFRCISRLDFKTDTFEDKVFIKDKTLRTGHVSSEEEYYDVNSSELEDSDPDFIDNTDTLPDTLPNTLPDHDSEPEAVFTQRGKRRCSRRSRVNKRKAALMSDSEEDNDKLHQDIISGCSRSPELFDKSSPPRASSSRNTGKMNWPFIPTTRNKKNPVVTSPLKAHVSPNRTTSIYFTSPKYNKSARWASLDQKVKSLKRKRSLKTTKKPGIAIKTLSPGNSTSKWLSTRSRDKSDKENRTPTKSSVNSQFKVPFKKKTSPKKLYDDPEDYFASILTNEEIN